MQGCQQRRYRWTPSRRGASDVQLSSTRSTNRCCAFAATTARRPARRRITARRVSIAKQVNLRTCAGQWRHCRASALPLKDCPPDAIKRAPNGEVFIADNCVDAAIASATVVRRDPHVVQTPKKPGLLQWLLFGRGSGPGEAPYDAHDRRGQEGGQVRHVRGVDGASPGPLPANSSHCSSLASSGFVRHVDHADATVAPAVPHPVIGDENASPARNRSEIPRILQCHYHVHRIHLGPLADATHCRARRRSRS